jgi:hypothetical protein
VIVRGDSQAPMITDGWIIFYSRDPEPDAAAVVGRLCIVKQADGPVMLKRVRRGPTTGRFNLESANAPLVEDVALEWAAPRPRHAAGRPGGRDQPRLTLERGASLKGRYMALAGDYRAADVLSICLEVTRWLNSVTSDFSVMAAIRRFAFRSSLNCPVTRRSCIATANGS